MGTGKAHAPSSCRTIWLSHSPAPHPLHCGTSGAALGGSMKYPSHRKENRVLRYFISPMPEIEMKLSRSAFYIVYDNFQW